MRVMGSRVLGAAFVVLGLLVGVLIVTVVYAVLVSATKSTEIRSQQQETSPLVKKIDKTSRRIRSCTTPGKPCYERGQRQTAKAVGNINRVVVYAAACASGPAQQTVEEIADCVTARLAKQQHR